MEAQIAAPTTILTLEMDELSQARFEDLRQLHFPAALNLVPAHLTLFHTLPPAAEIAAVVRRAAHRPSFALRVSGLRSLGRGVAYVLESREAEVLHADLSREFKEHLSAQDRQRFKPHVVVQNKATAPAAAALLARLQSDFAPFEVTGTGLRVWDYLGGPWRTAGFFNFR